MVSSAGAKVASDKDETPIHDKISALRQGKGALRSTAMGALQPRQGRVGHRTKAVLVLPLPHTRSYRKSGQQEGKRKGKHSGKEGVKRGV